MKAGIITKIGKNYGGVLQAYALKRKLCDLGSEGHVIKYIPENSKRSYQVCKYPWGPKGSVANLKALLHYGVYKRGRERFYQFRNDNYDFLGDYHNDQEIEANPPLCDVYISGSDQVWNPQISFDRSYYCEFAKKNPRAKVASYAASIGLKEIPEKYAEEFKKRVQGFDYVSVREKQALSTLKKMDVEARLAPDPTLLLSADEWRSVAAKPLIEEPYILCYFVSFPAEIERVVAQFKKKYGLKVVNLMLSEESASVGDIKIRDAGPKEFLSLFANASFVITSSFHGSVFSMINQKPFVVTLYKSTSSRVTELLENFGLSDRIISPDCGDISGYCGEDVYPEDFDEKLKAMREKGAGILKEITEVK